MQQSCNYYEGGIIRITRTRDSHPLYNAGRTGEIRKIRRDNSGRIVSLSVQLHCTTTDGKIEAGFASKITSQYIPVLKKYVGILCGCIVRVKIDDCRLMTWI